MKLELHKAWFEKMIQREGDLDVSAGHPLEETRDQPERIGQSAEDEFCERHAFGSLIQLLRRDRKLTVEQLAFDARVDAAEIIQIERDPTHSPKPRTVHQLAVYFGLPDRVLMKLSNVTTVHSPTLRDAAIKFAANSQKVMELTREERLALSDFVGFLSSDRND